MNKGVIAGIIIVVAIGIAAISFSMINEGEQNFDKTLEESLDMSETSLPESENTSQGRSLSVELFEQMNMRTP